VKQGLNRYQEICNQLKSLSVLKNFAISIQHSLHNEFLSGWILGHLPPRLERFYFHSSFRRGPDAFRNKMRSYALENKSLKQAGAMLNYKENHIKDAITMTPDFLAKITHFSLYGDNDSTNSDTFDLVARHFPNL